MTGRIRNILLLLLLGLAAPAAVCAEAGLGNEYKLKTAVIFKLLKFVDFPALEKAGDEKGSTKSAVAPKSASASKSDAAPRELVIGVCGGADEAYRAMLALQGITVKGRKITVRKLPVDDLLGTKKLVPFVYDILWIPRPSPNQKKPLTVDRILKRLKSPNALTIGEVAGFVDGGGMINLIKDKNRIGFEINLVRAKKAKVKINSSVLKLAKRVITPPKD